MFMHIAFWIVKLYMILWASSPILPTLESYLHPLHLLTLNPFSSSLFYMENPSWLFAIRYVGVIWFIFMFSNFYQFDLHNQIYFSLTNLWWNIFKNRIENWISSYLVTVFGSACCWFFDWMYRSSQLCSLLSVEWLLRFEDVAQSLLNMFVYDVCSLILARTTYQSNTGVRLRKRVSQDHSTFWKSMKTMKGLLRD